MKKLKNELREWVFEKLLLFLFKFSKTHKLIKFSKSVNGEKIIYEIAIRTFKDNTKGVIEEHLCEYFKNEANKNFIPRDNPLVKEWVNEGFFPKHSRRNITKDSEEIFKIRTSIMNLNSEQWRIIKTKETQELMKEPFILTTVRGLYNEVGFDGGMFLSDLSNEEEKRFVKLFYEYGRSKYV